jgi:glucosamine-6-phosphate deaminase
VSDDVTVLEQSGLPIHIYKTPEAMSAASARALSDKIIDLASQQDTVGFLIMAAPSAYGFYEAFLTEVGLSKSLEDALHRTHFYQFDDYPLAAEHPASFRYLLNKSFFEKLTSFCPPENIHPFNVDDQNPNAVCEAYTQEVLKSGLDIQLKGVGENGHWGFHEPFVPMNEDPAYIGVDLSEENVQQQMRDHPTLFTEESDVPRVAYTANVSLFMKTKHLIEDNIPQGSKGFALVAGYGNEVVNEAVPTSILKLHANAVVRTTEKAAQELLEYSKHGQITSESFKRMEAALGGGTMGDYMQRVFDCMQIPYTR